VYAYKKYFISKVNSFILIRRSNLWISHSNFCLTVSLFVFHDYYYQLFVHLNQSRWLRLLFGREFSMQDLLVIWDSIFSDGISFALCDYIFAAMLIAIRKLLLPAHYSQCMIHLMKYPYVTDIHYIIDMALHLREPHVSWNILLLFEHQKTLYNFNLASFL